MWICITPLLWWRRKQFSVFPQLAYTHRLLMVSHWVIQSAIHQTIKLINSHSILFVTLMVNSVHAKMEPFVFAREFLFPLILNPYLLTSHRIALYTPLSRHSLSIAHGHAWNSTSDPISAKVFLNCPSNHVRYLRCCNSN